MSVPTDILPRSWDKFLSLPLVFSFIVLFQGCFGGLGVVQTPEFMNKYNRPATRFFFLFLIAYTASQDIETALVSVAVFFAFLHLVRTPEERKKVKFPYF